MHYVITGLDPAPFQPLYGLSEAALAARGVRRQRVERQPGYPDRIQVRDAAIGETVLLLNFEHQSAATPYRASHAIFVLEGATERYEARDEIPLALRIRPISLRAFNAEHDMVGAELADGTDLQRQIEQFFATPGVAYLHAHYAKRGCYAARVDRA